MMAEAWYVPLTRASVTLDDKSVANLIQAAVPDDVYAIGNAWQQTEIKPGLWLLEFRAKVMLTDDQKKRMGEMGCRPAKDGADSVTAKTSDRATVLKNPTVIHG